MDVSYRKWQNGLLRGKMDGMWDGSVDQQSKRASQTKLELELGLSLRQKWRVVLDTRDFEDDLEHEDHGQRRIQ
jgi:hypothetical protein